MQIPKLLFQPIVENAVVHGIAKKVAGGEVSMIWEETEGGVFVKISNPMPETLPAQGFGIGLDSLKKRCLFFSAQSLESRSLMRMVILK